MNLKLRLKEYKNLKYSFKRLSINLITLSCKQNPEQLLSLK